MLRVFLSSITRNCLTDFLFLFDASTSQKFSFISAKVSLIAQLMPDQDGIFLDNKLFKKLGNDYLTYNFFTVKYIR